MKNLKEIMIEGIETNDLKKVAWALNLGADVNSKDKDGRSPLHYVRSVTIAELLISAGANVNSKSKWGNTPLHYAVYRDNEALAEYLISAGADVNAKDKDGESPLHLATLWDKVEMQDLLKQHRAIE